MPVPVSLPFLTSCLISSLCSLHSPLARLDRLPFLTLYNQNIVYVQKKKKKKSKSSPPGYFCEDVCPLRNIQSCPNSSCTSSSFLLSFCTFSFSFTPLHPSPLVPRCLSVHPSWSLFNSRAPPCSPLRCFPNSWRPWRGACRGPPLSSLRSLQAWLWDSEL